jgi:hypothetical protein
VASYHDLLDAIARIRSVTGDSDAWKKGLTGDDVTVACNPASPPATLGALLAKLTAAHPDVFLSLSPAGPQPAPPRIGEGAAAEAIRDAEAALAHQNTDAAHIDLQVVTAVLNARAAHDEGVAELVALQRDIEAAVASRTDLDTPAGAREFQRFLIAKLREIRGVVENSSLDATSKASLAAALATLYASTTQEPPEKSIAEDGPSESRPAPSGSAGTPRISDETPSAETMPVSSYALGPDIAQYGPDPLSLEPAWPDPSPPGLPAVAPPAAVPPPAAAPMPAPAIPAPTPPLPAPAPPMAIPPFTAGLPGGAPFAGGLAGPGSSAPSLPPLADLPRAELPHRSRDGIADAEPDRAIDPLDAASETAADQPGDDPGPAATEVDLPDGDVVTAPSPELAAAITAAVGGTPLADAFRLQGINLPPPGSPVAAPLDPGLLAPGDIGLFTDRHALFLGHGKALLDQQIQPIASVSGPGFLGWQHPPEPERTPEPTNSTPEIPAPNRSAATAPS